MNDRSLFKYTLVILCLPIIIAAGCEDRYRYACQNPKNWDKEMCQKPLCEVHRQCPDLIFKEDSAKVGLKDDQISKTNITVQTCEKGCDNGK
jgi:hypothetical protein